MKQYFTLVQDFNPVNERHLAEYLTAQNITYHHGADFSDELKRLPGHGLAPKLMVKCVVLIDEHELSAIMLSVGGVTIARNRAFVNAKNRVRGWFKWIVD